MTVTYQVLNISDGGGSENLLINPRGKINQASESDGVLSAGQYFCDGWKAGAAGAEVYRDADGFRLISGSILQLIPNNLDAGRPIKGNLDVISGTPAVRINGGTDSELSDAQTYITFEIVGNNSKFTRLILAESEDLPIYQQIQDELKPCQRFIQILDNPHIDKYAQSEYSWIGFQERMHQIPAWSVLGSGNLSEGIESSTAREASLMFRVNTASPIWAYEIFLDARL
ncbi:hypothetical protein [Vibrio sp. 624788]|uniref:hypothetical protein n=1 Tax=Vibrio sp. 624788 TaxID=1234362 RepID=UPI0002F2BA8B|nr:hypothetical protein [Vibrio sp. 624788]